VYETLRGSGASASTFPENEKELRRKRTELEFRMNRETVCVTCAGPCNRRASSASAFAHTETSGLWLTTTIPDAGASDDRATLAVAASADDTGTRRVSRRPVSARGVSLER
jgi:hypothetical protein